MPRTIDPSDLNLGSGNSSVAGTSEQPVPTPVTASTLPIADPFLRYLLGLNAQGAFNELAAMVPPMMGGVGSPGPDWFTVPNSGVPDWGILKLRDGSIPATANPAVDTHSIYPYYYRSPLCADGVGITGSGVDVASDPDFNYYDGGGYPAYTGGGVGTAHAGFTTVSMDSNPAAGYPTWRLIPAGTDPAAVVSGIVSPADRGVLALLYWPTGDLTAPPDPATSAADAADRCLAAILLGKGLESGQDGEPGGIFSEGSGALRAVGSVSFAANPAAGYIVSLDLTSIDGSFVQFTASAGAPATAQEFQRSGAAATTALNFAAAVNALFYPQTLVAIPSGSSVEIRIRQTGTAGNGVLLSSSGAGIILVQPTGGTDTEDSSFSIPGRASGQLDLSEIHSGTTILGGMNVFPLPAAGQVRLLTDPRAFSTVTPSTVTGGIPILGGTAIAIGTNAATYFPFGLGGGVTGNFFAYRLPYLQDYTTTTGLHHIPEVEKVRYITKIPPAYPGALTSAGAYANFAGDFWAFQIARYRHRFVLATGASGALRPDGSFALVHFKKEADFESYVRDGVVPTDEQIYSVNLIEWAGVARIDNLVESGSPPDVASPYAVQRSEVNEDPDGATAPTLAASTYTFGGLGTTTSYSGIPYYVPRDRTAADAPAFGLRAFNITLNGLWDNSYRTHDTIPLAGPLFGTPQADALNQNPVFMSLASFSFEGSENPVTSTITLGSTVLFPGSLGEIRRQRVEFGFADLTAGSDAPGMGDPATISATGIFDEGLTFTGDVSTPVFTSDARVRVFVRRPLADDPTVGDTLGYPLPYVGGNTGSSRGFTIPETLGKTILFHSLKETNDLVEKVAYGNPSTSGKATLNDAKDVSERFLDEVYRYPADWSPNPIAADVLQLVGPGLPTGVMPINVPVQPVDGDPNYPGWYFQGYHTDPTKITGLAELQVAGVPARNPDYTEGVVNPFPSRGLLLYPQKDYTNCLPAGSDYSAQVGDREYVRVFDGGASNAASTTVTLKFWGVALANFAYAPAGPGGVGMAIMVKIPGMSSWMDAGRADGDGPSKQDIALDGAGCQVVGPDTFDDVDDATQIHFAQVKLNVGPTAALFLNAEAPARCPVLVKIILKDNATGKAFNFEQGGEDGPTTACRGLVGIDIL